MKPINLLDSIPKAQWPAIQNGTSSFDCSPAMNQALATYGLPPGVTAPYSAAGPDIILDAGCKFYFGSDWNIKRRVRIMGSDSAGGNGSENTWCVFAPGTGIIVNSWNTTENTTDSGYQGVGTTLTGFTMSPTGQSNARPAIWLRGRANLSQLRIVSFGGNGVYANASTGGVGSLLGSCNQSHIQDVEVTGCAGDAFHMEGTDANAVQFIGCSAISCGGGFIDHSSVGINTYVGCHAAANGLDYQSIGASNLFVDCYEEVGGHSNIMHPAMVVGGNLSLDAASNGMLIAPTGSSAGPASSLGVRNGIAVTDPSSGRVVYLGSNWANGDILDFVDPVNFPLGLRLRQVGPDLVCDYANLDVGHFFKLTGPNTAYTGDGIIPIPYALVADRLFVGNRRI